MGENGEDQVSQSISDTEKYVVAIKSYIDAIKEDKPKDRVELAVAIARCLNGMGISVKGWASWLNNLEALKQLTIEELGDAYPKMKKVALEFLQIDLDVTQKKVEDAKKSVKESQSRKQNSKKTYVS